MTLTRQRSVRIAVASIAIPFLLGAAVLPAPALAAPAAPVVAGSPGATFDAWAEAFAARWVRLNPQGASATQYFSGAEQDALDRQLTPLSTGARGQVHALAREGIARLDGWTVGQLDDDQQVTAALMRWSLARVVEGAPFEDHDFIFSQWSGVHVGLVSFMTQTHPLRRAKDVDSYLARLEQIPVRIDEALVRARSAAARSLLPPRFILERAQGQVAAFLRPPAASNALVTSLAQRTAGLADLAPQARAEALAKATRIVEDQIRPAYARVQAFMAEIHPATTEAAGLSRLPNGGAAYAQALVNFTSTSRSAEEIHAIGLREVARIEGEMDRHLRALGYAGGSIEERMKKLDAAFQPRGEGDPRPALLARYAGMVRDAEARSAALFNLKPRAPVEVRREPPLTEPAASAHYTLPAPDGSLPGVFWVPLRGPDYEMAKMRSLSYHEAVPGHHFQLAIQQEQTSLPKFRSQRIFGGGSAYIEGWGLYAERLAVEQGWYEGDVPGLLGALGYELFRARRLVVDTGIHAKGWTRQQAIDYGFSEQEVERYVSWAGQANSYMTGMLRIVELREKAVAALGADFSLPAFHDVVLRTGDVPLDVLDEVIERWIARQKKG